MGTWEFDLNNGQIYVSCTDWGDDMTTKYRWMDNYEIYYSTVNPYNNFPNNIYPHIYFLYLFIYIYMYVCMNYFTSIQVNITC